MKVLYLHQYFATPASNGGTRSYEMAKRLIANGHDVTFLTSSAFLPNDMVLGKGWNYLEIEGMKVHVLHLPYSNNDSYLSRIFKFLNFCLRSSYKSLSLKADVVFATSTPLTIVIPGIIYSKVKKVPMVFEVRDLWPELPVAIGAIKNPLVIKAASLLEKLAYSNSEHIVALSPGMREGISKQGVSLDKITLATNSCDTELFDVDPAIGREYKKVNLTFVGNRKLVIYTGTFGAINDVEYIVKLALVAKTSAPELCFLAIGDGMEKQKVVDAATNSGVLGENLFILDPIPKTEIVKLLSAADLALSLFGPVKEMWHNSANKLFDALASQTPVAINYGGWQKDFIEASSCGIVLDPETPETAVKKIKCFLASDHKYKSAVNACKELSYNHYSRDIMAERLESVLREVSNVKA
ncbi:glycosyltransferase family 4 protein [Vibrio vulnificus]|uniref:glycosyltransferase family 4 protein n=1 Tax=Vibrio vulnificus TaxID=672 RepID=UPI001CDB4C94|nr:glycosyltransferase family 4 protein [Vibrio vulnificus]EKO5170318.1 glycosyltransferase family 4 protein [Vibrio vulnificus]MCA3940608.1 glycosyltransferase family 4 protein [Vibrio vulnificus]